MHTTHLLYLHGFKSSPRSTKAQQLAARVAQDHPGVTWHCPQLPPSPRRAIDMLVQAVAGWPRHSMAIAGSSLGGYYATWLAEQHGCKAVLLNPAIHPQRDLVHYLGEQAAWHDPQKRFVFEPWHIDELKLLQCGGPLEPRNYYVVIAKGDEVLDWREMRARYPGAVIRLLEAGDHALSDFEIHIDGVLEFLDLA